MSDENLKKEKGHFLFGSEYKEPEKKEEKGVGFDLDPEKKKKESVFGDTAFDENDMEKTGKNHLAEAQAKIDAEVEKKSKYKYGQKIKLNVPEGGMRSDKVFLSNGAGGHVIKGVADMGGDIGSLFMQVLNPTPDKVKVTKYLIAFSVTDHIAVLEEIHEEYFEIVEEET
jgi:hypothetical protein